MSLLLKEGWRGFLNHPCWSADEFITGISDYDLDKGDISFFFVENLPEEALSERNDMSAEFKTWKMPT